MLEPVGFQVGPVVSESRALRVVLADDDSLKHWQEQTIISYKQVSSSTTFLGKVPMV